MKKVRLSAAGKKPGLADLLALSGRQYLYQLPWYIFIGAPGSGKTTALINSGLQFPLADSLGTASIRGVGGTRNCDWWFTDEVLHPKPSKEPSKPKPPLTLADLPDACTGVLLAK